jgi:hypothetical protein
MRIQEKSDQTARETTNLEKAKLIWDEYKYRHEHCWKLIFQITAAVVAVSIIPFTNVEIATSLRYWIVALPALGFALILFSLPRMNNELDLLDKIRRRHRELQRDLQGLIYEERRSTFSRDVKLYLGALALISVIDILAIVLVWIPSLK